MKVDFNPHAAAQAQNARGPQAQTTPTQTTPPEASDDGVEITLSQAAKQMLKTGDADYDGKSPAHQARQFIANSLAATSAEDGEAPDFSGPFGQIVKTFAPGHNKEPEGVEAPDAVPEDGGDTGGTTETGETGDTSGSGDTEGGDTTVTDGSDGGGDTDTGDTGTTEGSDTTVTDGSDGGGDTGTTEGGDTTVVDGSDGGGDTGTTDGGDTTVTDGSDGTGTTDGGDTTVVAAPEEGDGTGSGETDPTIVVEEPDITELLDDSAPADGETSGTESGLAGSGDAVATVDTGEVTDELLDQLDGNGEEVV